MSGTIIDIDTKRKIDDRTMDNVELLAKLMLTGDERVRAMAEMEKILSYADKLNELDTSNVVPLVHVMPDSNVFREDKVMNDDWARAALANAPEKKDSYFMVPKTV